MNCIHITLGWIVENIHEYEKFLISSLSRFDTIMTLCLLEISSGNDMWIWKREHNYCIDYSKWDDHWKDFNFAFQYLLPEYWTALFVTIEKVTVTVCSWKKNVWAQEISFRSSTFDFIFLITWKPYNFESLKCDGLKSILWEIYMTLDCWKWDYLLWEKKVVIPFYVTIYHYNHWVGVEKLSVEAFGRSISFKRSISVQIQ